MENIAESPYNVTQISVVTQQIIHMLSFRITMEFYKYCTGRSKNLHFSSPMYIIHIVKQRSCFYDIQNH